VKLKKIGKLELFENRSDTGGDDDADDECHSREIRHI
jgi:hypothetical protein